MEVREKERVSSAGSVSRVGRPVPVATGGEGEVGDKPLTCAARTLTHTDTHARTHTHCLCRCLSESHEWPEWNDC